MKNMYFKMPQDFPAALLDGKSIINLLRTEEVQ